MDQKADSAAPERVICGSAEGEIGAIERERGFLGCWKCSACKQFGVSAATYWNRPTALAWARAAVTAHAESCHLGDSRGHSAGSYARGEAGPQGPERQFKRVGDGNA
jgi:hypothetical protein